MKRVFHVLAILLAVGCGRPEETHSIVQGRHEQKLTETEIYEDLANGSLQDTAVVFEDNQWVTVKEHPKFREKARVIVAGRTNPEGGSSKLEDLDRPVWHINAAAPGEEIDISRYLVPGKTVIFDFSSIYCGPCVQIAPHVENLAVVRPNTVVRVVDINRPDVRGIDWTSPVARQYGLRSIPYFRVYDGDGGLVASGSEAANLVYEWIDGSE